MPVILAKKAIEAGEGSFTVLADNTTAVGNLQRLGSNQGFEVCTEETSDGFRLSFSRNGEESIPPMPEIPGISAAPAGDYAIFVGSDIIGSGDRELGTALMQMFFYTLVQSDSLPRSILFMNAGVKLPAGDEQVIEHLRALMERGVQVLVCGTCLNFYGLTELGAGTVSNMYDIVTAMQTASKVVSL